MKICRVNEMRQLDCRAIEEFGITQELLMENAGQAAYFTIINEFGLQNKDFVIFCGVGNNGGDGLVVARKLYSNGGRVTVFILGDRSKFKGAAKLNFEIVQKLQIKMLDLNDITSTMETVQRSDAIIDAIFGTGLDREVKGKHKDVIDMINKSRKTVFSIDIASGIHGDTGKIMGTAVKADYTITFGLPKIGNLLYPGFAMGGKLYVTHISFPPVIQHDDELKIATNDPEPMPARNQDTHKGNYGKVLFIAGSSNYLGAPYFAALSFLKAGGGLSFLATPETVSSFIGNKGSEIIFVPQKPTTTGSIGLENKEQLLEFSENVDMVIMGPGLSLHKETQTLVRKLSAEIRKPLLIDGDGITAVAGDWDCIKERKAPTILTPHMGEMARMTSQKIDDITANKIDILQSTALELNSIIVLKGAHTLIAYPDRRVFLNLSGNPGMATAGSGDVLTGTIAAMFGLGFAMDDAVRTGVFVHGFAGDLAAKEKGEDGMIAGDIMNHLPACMKMYRDEYHSMAKDYYHKIFII
ncbi:MAG: NAD(P)H-hydrate epimerase [Bacteroides sp. SM23_62]|nr:MAG: NAD(P)H-hydrate epimerase [Bacteroides sp. SM23_62]